MTQLSQEQEEMRAAIRKKAMTWGIVMGVIVAALVWWLLGSQSTALRGGGALIAGFAVGFTTLRKSMSSGADSARCPKCNAAFSISQTDSKEEVTSSEEKEEREEQEDKSTNVTKWVEDKVTVTETFTCASCGDVTQKESQLTRRRDEEKSTEPAPAPKEDKKAGKSEGKSGKSGKSAASSSTKKSASSTKK